MVKTSKRKKHIVMLVRVTEDEEGLNMSNPFFGGYVNDDDEMRTLVAGIRSDTDRPKGIVMPKRFDARKSMTEIYKTAMRSFSDLYDQLVEAKEVSMRKKKK